VLIGYVCFGACFNPLFNGVFPKLLTAPLIPPQRQRQQWKCPRLAGTEKHRSELHEIQ